MEEKEIAVEGIRKKLVGKELSYKEIFAIMDEIAHERLGQVLTTYFAASGYSKGFSDKEIYYLTKAMVATGERLHFKGIVADKHSIGGVPGTRTTLIVVPIIAAAGFTIPKSSSRAITTPGGTADDMEVLSRVEFSKKEIYEIVKKTNGCIVWGGSVDIAPADDILIHVEAPLLFESYDKILVSIMAKKIAFGSNHVVIDLPYGKLVKVHRLSDAFVLKKKFEKLAKSFNVSLTVMIHRTDEPAGKGIGPVLECREALRVLQQKKNRPLDLEVRSINLSGTLLTMCLQSSSQKMRDEVKKTYGNAFGWATKLLHSGKAYKKMQEIIAAQGGKPNLDSEDLHPGAATANIKALHNGTISSLNSKNLTVTAKILGAPKTKSAGIFLHGKIGEAIKKGEILFTLYSDTMYNIKEAKESLKSFPVLEY